MRRTPPPIIDVVDQRVARDIFARHQQAKIRCKLHQASLVQGCMFKVNDRLISPQTRSKREVHNPFDLFIAEKNARVRQGLSRGNLHPTQLGNREMRDNESSK